MSGHLSPLGASGLSSIEAAERLRAGERNELPAPPRPSVLTRFARQLVHFFAVMLWVAGGLAIVAGLAVLGIAIFAVVLVNGTFAFLQEARSDRAAERLRALLPRRITVRRDGRPVQIEVAEVVVGDLLLLEAGDRVPADASVVAANGAVIDTSMLTGESQPETAQPGTIVYAGTFLVEGEVRAVVTATGHGTRLARIAALTTERPSPPSPLTIELHRVVRVIAVIAVFTGLVFMSLALLLGRGFRDSALMAIGVTVALVPEALLPTVTLSLAWGAEQMSKRRVLVRKLDAVETLGSTTFICTDKTGTLTRNEMVVVEVWTPAGSATIRTAGYGPEADIELSAPDVIGAISEVAHAAARCSAGYAFERDGTWTPHGDPTEVALDVLARRLGFDTDRDRLERPIDVRFPFDSRRRRMSVVTDGAVIVKGAPDSVLPLCVAGSEDGAAIAVQSELTGRGLRVLAIARGVAPVGRPSSADDIETDLELLGIVAMEDPPRADASTALTACRRAGIAVAMVTGDHPATAAAIATEVGLRREDDPVVSGSELPADDAELGALLDRDGIVVARVSPEDKLRIARCLRARGHVVAMTGDGVNDGPALHEADIGIAMGASGTDVAREAADLVLLDDNFASIVDGIEQGRATFVNVRRFLTYHLTDNVTELTPFVVWALSGGRFPLALGVLQILALDLGTDTFSAVALGAEPPARHLLVDPPVRGRLLNRSVVRRAFGILGPTEAAMTMLAFVLTFVVAGWRPGDPFPGGATLATASGAAFMTVVLAQTANAFACRSSTRWPGALGWTTNRLLIPAASIEVVFSLVVVFVAPIADEFGHAPPSAIGWTVAGVSMLVVLGVDALDKQVRRARGQHRAPGA